MDIKSLKYIFYVLIICAFIYFGIVFYSEISVTRSIGIIQPIVLLNRIMAGIINFPQNNCGKYSNLWRKKAGADPNKSNKSK